MRIIRKPELLKKVGLSYPTIWRKEKAGQFPKHIPLGPNATGWIESEIDQWIADLATSREKSSV